MDGTILPPDGDAARLRAELAQERQAVVTLRLELGHLQRDYDRQREAMEELRAGLDRIAGRDLDDASRTYRAHARAMQADARRAVTRAEGG